MTFIQAFLSLSRMRIIGFFKTNTINFFVYFHNILYE